MPHRYSAQEFGPDTFRVFRTDASGENVFVAEFYCLQALNDFMDAMARVNSPLGEGPKDRPGYKPSTFRRYSEEMMRALQKL